MSVNLSEALNAYQQALKRPVEGGAGADDGLAPQAGSGSDFAAMLRDAAESAQSSLQQGEVASLKAAAGQADINDVVVAVSKAEMTLQTVVTLRDRAVQAYQDILRMPI